MKLPSIRRLNERGVAHHFLLPVVAILAVAGIGTYVLQVSHAATVTSYYSSACIKSTTLDQSCTLAAQELMDGIQHQGKASLGLTAPTRPGVTGVFKYTDGKYYLLMNGQYGTYTAQAVTAVTHNANGQLTGGQTGSWQALCVAAVSAGLSPGGGAASSLLKFGTASGETATQPNQGVFANACGSKVNVTPTPTSPSTSASNAKPCTSYTFSTTSNNAGSASKTCIYYIQSVLNNAYAKNSTYATQVKSFDQYYKDGYNGGQIGGVSPTDNNYNLVTKVRVMALQATFDAANGTTMGVDGVTNSTTWGTLCVIAKAYGTKAGSTTISTAANSGCASVSGSMKVRSPLAVSGSNGAPTLVSASCSLTSNGSAVSCTLKTSDGKTFGPYQAPIAAGCSAIASSLASASGMPAAQIAAEAQAFLAQHGVSCAAQTVSASAMAKQESAYKDTTTYASSICTTMRAYPGVNPAIQHAYLNCWNSKATSACVTYINEMRAVPNTAAGLKEAQTLIAQHPTCF